MTKLWDISPPVNRQTPVFPGDTPYSQSWVATIGPGCPVNVSAITTTPHIGAHADAPLHYDPQGQAIGAVPLAPYLGPCRVVHVLSPGPLVTWQALESACAAKPPMPPRLLVRTYARMPHDCFDSALSGFDPQALERLADLDVVLVGIDSASIDPADSKTLESHQVIRRRGMRVLENLCLDLVPPGDYELIALPLKLMDADASPVRAVLRELP